MRTLLNITKSVTQILSITELSDANIWNFRDSNILKIDTQQSVKKVEFDSIINTPSWIQNPTYCEIHQDYSTN